MLILVIVLLVLWLVVAVIGFAFKSLLWLGIVGIILFLATGVIGFIRRRTTGRSHTAGRG